MLHDVKSVLIVEDSKTQRTILEMMCTELGIDHVVGVENGQEALEYLEDDNSVDLMLCDLELPELNGIELINHISKTRKNFALVIMSGREQSLISSVELMAKSEGFYTLGGYRKPFSQTELEAVLGNFDRNRLIQVPSFQKREKPFITIESFKNALSANEFTLYFQPKVFCENDELEGVEALIRWKHPEYGMIAPDDFIPFAIENNLINELTLLVVKKSIDALTRWETYGLNTKISINLSAKSFTESSFSQQILNILSTGNIKPSQLTFEVTETEVIHDIGSALSLLTKLRLAGFGLSIDDYGTGQSSIKQLTQIPFTELKIDRSLIEDIHLKDHLKVIFESTLRMCSKMDIKVVAEGIEKIEEWDYLTQAGCDIAQGYLICPPVTEEVLQNWIKNGMRFFH